MGSPTAAEPHSEFQTDYAEALESSLRLRSHGKGKRTVADRDCGFARGTSGGREDDEHPTADFEALWKESANYYRDYLARTVTLDCRTSSWKRPMELRELWATK